MMLENKIKTLVRFWKVDYNGLLLEELCTGLKHEACWSNMMGMETSAPDSWWCNKGWELKDKKQMKTLQIYVKIQIL